MARTLLLGAELALPTTTGTATTIAFQCQSNSPIVINFTATDSAPAATAPGLVYKHFEGEVKKTVTDLTHVGSAAYVWAKALTGDSAKVVYEDA
jgi:hypothetical protein